MRIVIRILGVLLVGAGLVGGSGLAAPWGLGSAAAQTESARRGATAGSAGPIRTAPEEAASFEWSFTGGATAGVFKDVTLTVRDASNDVVTDYADTVFISTTAPRPEEWGLGGANGVLDTLSGGQWYYVFDPADAGAAALRVKIFDAGDFTLGAVRGSIEGTSGSLSVTHGPEAAIAWTTTSQNVTVGSDTEVGAVLKDQFGNAVPGVDLTIFIRVGFHGLLKANPDDPTPTTSLGPTARRGTTDANGRITVLYQAPGTAGLTDTIDAFTASVAEGSVPDLVFTSVASGATKLRIVWETSSTATAGATFRFRIEAVDTNNNLDTSNTSTVNITPQGGSGLLFSESDWGTPVTQVTLSGGQRVVYGQGYTSGAWSFDADDVGPLAPASENVQITSAGVDHYDVSAPGSVTAGAIFNVTVVARDEFGNRVTTANDTVNLEPVDPVSENPVSPALLVPQATLSSGQAVVAENYTAARSIKVRAKDTGDKKGLSGVIVVSPAGAYQIVRVTLDLANVVVGTAVLHIAEVRDPYGNAVPGETVTFSAPSGGGSVDPPSAVTGADGRVTFSHTTGEVVGLNTARATILDGDPVNLERAEWLVQTIAGALASYDVSAPGSATAGANFNVTIVARDEYGNKVTTANNNVNIDPVDPVTLDVVTPSLSVGSTTLVSGEKTVGETYTKAWPIRIRARDGTLNVGYSTAVVVNAGTAYEVVKISGDGTITAGGSRSLVVEVRDPWGNAVLGHSVFFAVTGSPGGAYVTDTVGDPNDGITTTNAQGQAAVELHTSSTAGTNTVRATINDGNPPALETKTFTVNTTAGTIAKYQLVTPVTEKRAGLKIGFTVRALDDNDNLVDDDVTQVTLSLAKGTDAVFDQNPVTLQNGTFVDSVRTNTAPQVLQVRALDPQGKTGLGPDITVRPNYASGTITAAAAPDTITATGTSTSVVTSGIIRDAYNNIVETGTLVTAATNLGTITSTDVDGATPGIQRATNAEGRITFVVQSGTTTGTANVTMTAVPPGTASGTKPIVFASKPVIANPGNPSPNVVIPGQTVAFTVNVTNTSQTGVTLSTATTFKFDDGADYFTANLASATYIDGGASRSLTFASAVVPVGMDPRSYTPSLGLVGTDEFDSPFPLQTLALPANSLRVSAIEIVDDGIVPSPPVVKRGQEGSITVSVWNKGPVPVTIETVNFTFSTGNHFDYEPVLTPPVVIPANTILPIERSVTVLQTAPINPLTTIDASVAGNVGGTPVSDTSLAPYLPLPTWDVRAGAEVVYTAGSLVPMTVSRTKTYGLKIGLHNGGDATVELKTPQTTISFTDGAATYLAALKQNEALGAGASKVVEFNAVQVPAGIQANRSYDVEIHLEGLENLSPFTADLFTSDGGDSIRVVTPASVAYVAGSLTPTTVSRTIPTFFTLKVRNTGTAQVDLTPASTTFSFGGGGYSAALNPSGGTTILPGDTTTLTFNSQTVSVAAGSYTPQLRLVGTENTLFFDTSPTVTNQVTVQEPASISILSIRPSQDSITRDQSNPITMTMTVRNNQAANVRFDSASLGFLLNGSTDLTSFFAQTPPSGFFTYGTTLPGNATDSLVFTVGDGPGTMTAGTYVVEGVVCVTDLVGGQQTCASTSASGSGKGSLFVQNTGVLDIRRIVSSQPSVTAGQTQAWTAAMTVKNTGVVPAAAIDLDLGAASTAISFFLGTGWVSALQTPGPISLGQNDSTTLVFSVSPTGNTAGAATIDGIVRGTETNSGVTKTDQTPPGQGSVVVQTAANLQITQIAASRDTVTEGQTTAWTIAVSVVNTGGAAVTLSDLAAQTYVEFPGAVPVARVTGPAGTLALPGFGETVLTFTVSPTPGFGGVPGMKSFDVRVQGTETNRGVSLVANASGSVLVQLRPDPQYVAGSLEPTAARPGDEAQFRLVLSERAGASTLKLNAALTKLSFDDGAAGHAFRPVIDTDVTDTIVAGDTTRIWFVKGIVPSGFVAGTFPVSLQLAGVENGNGFSKGPFVLPDSVTIREPAGVRVDSVIVSRDRVSAGQTRTWEVEMAVANTGSGDVTVRESATELVFRMSGVNQEDYLVSLAPVFANSRNNVLPAGLTDTLTFTVYGTGSAPGSVSIDGIFGGRDEAAQKDVSDDTFDRGRGAILVQRAGALRVTGVQTSRSTVTQGQTTSWNAAVAVENTGEAAVQLAFDAGSPAIRFLPGAGFGSDPPEELQGGGAILPGGAVGTLVFGVSPTGTQPGTAVIHAVVAGVDTNSAETKTWDTEANGSGSGSIVVQSRGRAVVASTAIAAPNEDGEVNVGQLFGVRVEITNAGGAALSNVAYRISSDGGSAPQLPKSDTLVAPLIGIGETVVGLFEVTADGVAGPEALAVDVLTGTDVNSGQVGLLDIGPHADPTAAIEKVEPSRLAVDSVTSSQTTVTKSQVQDWYVDVAVTNEGGAALDVIDVAASDLAFFLGVQQLTDYVVVPPTRFVGRPGLRLGPGESDVLRYTVDVTGADVGSVTILATVDWRDENDLQTSSAQNSGAVTVVSPSGFLITETVADPATAPNSPQTNFVFVNTGQPFRVMVTVQNSNGGSEVEDLEDVRVRLASDYAAAPVNLTLGPVEIPRNEEYTFAFDVSLAPLAGDVRQEILTSAIVSARSKQTGQTVTPNPPVDNQEIVIVQRPASLQPTLRFSQPSVSTGQAFTVWGRVVNEGGAGVDDTGRMALILLDEFTNESPSDTVFFTAGAEFGWSVRAPSDLTGHLPITVKITQGPNDLNIGAPAAIADSVVTGFIDVSLQAGFSNAALEITAPSGATDHTVSTHQQFTLSASADAEGTTTDITAKLSVLEGEGFVLIDPDSVFGIQNTGRITAAWRVTAPLTARLGTFRVKFHGKDENTLEEFSYVTPDREVTVVDRAALRVSAAIARPAEAADGKVAIGSRFEIDAGVANLGTADVLASGGRVRINFSGAPEYGLYEGTAERDFTIGQTITWVVNAPSAPAVARNIVVEISATPADENTGAAAYLDRASVPIPVQTDDIVITADNVSRDLGLEARVVPKGTDGVEMLAVEFANSDATVGRARIETIRVSLLAGSGDLAGSPSRTLGEVYATVRGHRVDGALSDENPVVFDFTSVPGGVVLELAGQDSAATIIFSASVREDAELGEMIVAIEAADDVVIRGVEYPNNRVPIIDKDTRGSVAGRLRSMPLVILGGGFEEYAHNYPNPFRAGFEVTRIAYRADDGASVAVRIFDIMGSLVYEKRFAPDEPVTTAPGAQTVTWDGTNMKGETVRNGIYICQLDAGGKSTRIRIAVAK